MVGVKIALEDKSEIVTDQRLQENVFLLLFFG